MTKQVCTCIPKEWFHKVISWILFVPTCPEHGKLAPGGIMPTIPPKVEETK